MIFRFRSYGKVGSELNAWESGYGYEAPWTGIVKVEPSPNELHALITSLELPDLTHLRHCMVC